MLISLGRWQLRRAEEKRVLFHAFAAGTDATRLIDLGTPRLPRYQHIEAGGRYDEGRQILIDNMVNDGRAGYFVITPFALTGGGWLLVNRGWVPLGASRAVRPTIPVTSDTRRLLGRADNLPRSPAFRWVQGEACAAVSRGRGLSDSCRAGSAPRRILWARATDLVLLDLPSPTAMCAVGRRPDFHRCVTSAMRWQWFALALTLLVIYVVTNLRRNAEVST